MICTKLAFCAGSTASADSGRGYGDGGAGGDDPYYRRAQSAGTGQGRGGGRQPHVDRLRIPAARADAVRL